MHDLGETIMVTIFEVHWKDFGFMRDEAKDKGSHFVEGHQ